MTKSTPPPRDPEIYPGLSFGEVAPMMIGGVPVNYKGVPLDQAGDDHGWAYERHRALQRDLRTDELKLKEGA